MSIKHVSRATPFGCGLNIETCEARYEKAIAQFTVRTLYASVRTGSREIRDRLIFKSFKPINRGI
jgi:hypothetical protein